MTEYLKNFILENQVLINKNTKESWEEIYSKAPPGLTETLLKANIDPAEILEYIPRVYLIDSTITTYDIPNNVESIGDYAFENCSNLTNIIIPDSVTSIGYAAFQGCISLKSVNIGNNVINIGSYTFHNCTSLTSVTIGNSVTSIGMKVFYGCSSLINIAIPDSVISIGSGAFNDCSGLTSITIPDSVTSIGRSAFKGCSSLTTINYNGTKQQWNKIKKLKDWDAGTGNYTIICKDGRLKKNESYN